MEKALAEPVLGESALRISPPSPSVLNAYLAAQTRFGHLLRTRPMPDEKHPTDTLADQRPDHAWLARPCRIPDGGKPGRPGKRQEDREYPTNPPLRELLDPGYAADARRVNFPIDTEKPKLLAFPFENGQWQLHHAAPFAAVRWTNIHDPALLIAFGDLISSPAAPVFGRAVVDVNLKPFAGQSCASRTEVLETLETADVPVHIAQLRKALDLGGTERPCSAIRAAALPASDRRCR